MLDHELIRRVERLEREIAALRAAVGAGSAVAVGIPESRGRAVPAAPPIRAAAAAPAPPPPHLVRHRPAPAPPHPDGAVEANVVGTWFARIGVVAILLGAAFAFKYAVDRGLIGPTGRVLAGAVGGLAFVAWSERALRRGWPRLAQAVAGGGLGLLYLSLWAGFALYGLLPAIVAFLLLAVVVIAGVALALRHDSMALAILALFGGFLNPYVTGISREPTALFGYVLLLDAGILALASPRRWPPVEGVAMAGTWLIALAAAEGTTAMTVQAFATSFFALFTARALVHAWRRRPADAVDLSLLAANAWAFLWVAMRVLPDGTAGPFTLALGAVHGTLAVLAWRRHPQDRYLWLALAGLGVGFATLAVPIHLDGPGVAIVWAIEGLVLVWLGRAAGLVQPMIAGLAVLGLSLLASVIVDFWLGAAYRPERVLFSSDALTLVLQIVAVHAVGWLLRREPAGGWRHGVGTAALVTAHALTVFWISLEARVALRFPTELEAPARYGVVLFTYTAIWALYAGGLLVVGIVSRSVAVRLMAVALFALTLAKLVLVDLWQLEPLHRTLGFTGAGVLLLLGSVLYHRFRNLIVEGR